jgi:hypothetical protein
VQITGMIVAMATTLLFLAGCGQAETSYMSPGKADGLTPVEQQKSGIIELSKEEARKLEIMNWGVADEKLAGGQIVLAPGNELTRTEKDAYKANLFKAGGADQQELEEVAQQEQRADGLMSWCGYHLSNVQYRGGGWLSSSPAGVSVGGPGPTNLNLEVSGGYSAMFSTNVGVSAEVVSAGVGYSVTASYSVSHVESLPVPSGYFARQEAYIMYNKHTWDVWENGCIFSGPAYKGNGASFRPNGGVYFRHMFW